MPIAFSFFLIWPTLTPRQSFHFLKGMLRIPGDLDRFAVYNLNQKPARIRAIIKTYRSLDLAGQKTPSYEKGKLETVQYPCCPAIPTLRQYKKSRGPRDTSSKQVGKVISLGGGNDGCRACCNGCGLAVVGNRRHRWI